MKSDYMILNDFTENVIDEVYRLDKLLKHE